MLQIDNKTPLLATIGIFPDEEGIDTIYPIVKGVFALDNRVNLARDQLPFVMADEYYGDPESSSISHASEVLAAKPATDVLMIGHAHAPGGQPVASVDVTLSVAERNKTVRVFGDRQWRNGFFGNSLSEPAPFKTIPLIYERAYGGVDPTAEKPPLGDEYNPVGQCFCHPKGRRTVDGMIAPNLEDPKRLMVRPQDHPRPACFGPVASSWLPRLNYAGTYDEDWQEKKAPFLPADFDPRFYNVAPTDQIHDPYLVGNERVQVINGTPEGHLEFALPKMELAVELRFGSESKEVSMNLDTVCVEPDQYRLTMIWRGRHHCDKKVLKMDVAVFELKNVGAGVGGF